MTLDVSRMGFGITGSLSHDVVRELAPRIEAAGFRTLWINHGGDGGDSLASMEVASAVTSTSRQVGVSIGVALCGSVAGSAMAGGRADFATTARPLWFVCIALGLVILGMGIFSTSQRALRSAERLAPLIAGASDPVSGTHVR